MKNKLKIPLLFFILVYANQSLSSLPGQAEYYLLREHWMLSAGTIGLLGFVSGLSWYIKILWGFFVDYLKIGKNSTKNYLIINYTGILLLYGFIVMFGVNFWTLLFTGMLINCFIGCSDVACDAQMCVLEQKHNLSGKIQSCQWTASGVTGVIVALGGAFIANSLPVAVAYRYAYGFAMILPIITLIYICKFYKEEPVERPKKVDWSIIFKELKNKRLLISLLFIACLQLCPSFGTPLMIMARESLRVEKTFLGILGATSTVLGVVGYVLYYWKCHKIGLEKLLYFMVIFSGITNLFYLYIPNQWFLLAYNILFGAFEGIAFISFLAFFAKIVPKGNEGLFYALVTSVSNLCGRGGAWLGTIIFDNYGYNMTVIISSILALLCVFFIPMLKINKK